MSMKRISLPATCFSCVHYTQEGWLTDQYAPTKDAYGLDVEQKKQRYGRCSKSKNPVFWNERCGHYSPEPDVDVHECAVRPDTLTNS